MSNLMIPLRSGPPGSTKFEHVLGKLEPGTKLFFTRRGLAEEFRVKLVMVLSDAIVVSRMSNDNPIIVRMEAIDTMELIHESA